MDNQDSSLKAIRIIEACSDAGRDGIGITEIVEHTRLSRSTVHRLVGALAESGYLRRKEDSKKYKLGYKLLGLASVLIDDLEIKDLARPYLQTLSAFCQETVHLVKRDGHYGVYVDKIDSPQAVGLMSKIGARIMLHCTGAGKVLLAFMDEEQRNLVYQMVGIPRQTPTTITDVHLLEQELHSIRLQGYALDNMENRDGIYCIAAPVFNHRKQVVAAFSVSGPAYRFTMEHAIALQAQVKETSLLISRQLGYRA